MPIRRVVILLGVVLITSTLLLTVNECRPRRPRNSIIYLASRQDVSEDKVRSVVDAFGLDPRSLPSFGPQDFPINYVARRLEETKREHGQVTRADVDTIMRGYDAKCEGRGGSATYYLYYSTNLDVNGDVVRPGIAMVIEIGYGVREGTQVTGWLPWDPRDSGFEPTREDIRTACGI